MTWSTFFVIDDWFVWLEFAKLSLDLLILKSTDHRAKFRASAAVAASGLPILFLSHLS